MKETSLCWSTDLREHKAGSIYLTVFNRISLKANQNQRFEWKQFSLEQKAVIEKTANEVYVLGAMFNSGY